MQSPRDEIDIDIDSRAPLSLVLPRHRLSALYRSALVLSHPLVRARSLRQHAHLVRALPHPAAMVKRALARNEDADDSSGLGLGNVVASRASVKHIARLESVITDATAFHSLLSALRASSRSPDRALISQAHSPSTRTRSHRCSRSMRRRRSSRSTRPHGPTAP